MKHIYDIGNTYGMKQLLDLIKQDGRTVAKVQCVECGRVSFVRPNTLFHDKYTSCTCRHKTVNGDSESRLYKIYHGMKYRCNTPTAHEFYNYGGRGIKVCDEWLGDNGYINFKKWAESHGYNNELTIDRVDSNLGYSPDNCRWVTLSENVSAANSSKRVQHRKSNNGTYYCISPDGIYTEFDNASEFARNKSLNAQSIRDAANRSSKYNGYQFGFTKILHDVEPQSTIENKVIPS